MKVAVHEVTDSGGLGRLVGHMVSGALGPRGTTGSIQEMLDSCPAGPEMAFKRYSAGWSNGYLTTVPAG